MARGVVVVVSLYIYVCGVVAAAAPARCVVVVVVVPSLCVRGVRGVRGGGVVVVSLSSVVVVSPL